MANPTGDFDDDLDLVAAIERGEVDDYAVGQLAEIVFCHRQLETQAGRARMAELDRQFVEYDRWCIEEQRTGIPGWDFDEAHSRRISRHHAWCAEVWESDDIATAVVPFLLATDDGRRRAAEREAWRRLHPLSLKVSEHDWACMNCGTPQPAGAEAVAVGYQPSISQELEIDVEYCRDCIVMLAAALTVEVL